jgi:putative membrane protein
LTGFCVFATIKTLKMANLLFNIISGVLGLYLAAKFVPGVYFSGKIQTLLMAGVLIGLANFFLKPLLKTIALPLRIITLGLFSLLINMFIIWLAADVLFPKELEISGLIALFWTTAIIWAISFFFGLNRSKK